MESQNRLSIHVFVSGRVQGVGYRKFAQRQARELKLAGWVRNRMDGRVEAFASGTQTELNLWLEALNKGPLFSQVEKVDSKEVKATDLPTDFAIHPDEELKT